MITGKTYNIKGENRKVTNVDDTYAYFAGGARIKLDSLMTKYEEVMDPSSFFNSNSGGVDNIANELKNYDTNSMQESSNRTSISNVNYESQEVQKIENNRIEDLPETKVINKGVNHQNNNNDFFSKIKRNNDIEIDFSITEKFPDLEFVKMMNDNYETSIIDHFATEIVEKLVYDPQALLDSVKQRLHFLVYGEELNSGENVVTEQNNIVENEQEADKEADINGEQAGK